MIFTHCDDWLTNKRHNFESQLYVHLPYAIYSRCTFEWYYFSPFLSIQQRGWHFSSIPPKELLPYQAWFWPFSSYLLVQYKLKGRCWIITENSQTLSLSVAIFSTAKCIFFLSTESTVLEIVDFASKLPKWRTECHSETYARMSKSAKIVLENGRLPTVIHFFTDCVMTAWGKWLLFWKWCFPADRLFFYCFLQCFLK